MERNVLCSEDGIKPAVCCCFCRFPLPLICESCLSKHPMDTEHPVHFHLPIIAGQCISSNQVKDQFRPWLYKLHSAYSALMRNEEVMGRFGEQLEATCQESQFQFTEELNRHRSDAHEKLTNLRQSFKHQLQTAFQEVCWYSVKPQWVPEADSLAGLMWNYDGTASLNVFQASVRKVGEQVSDGVCISMKIGLPAFAHFEHESEESTEVQTLRKELALAKEHIQTVEQEKTSLTNTLISMTGELATIEGPILCTQCRLRYLSEFSTHFISYGCRVCTNCQTELAKANYGFCFCGNFFHPNSAAAAGQVKWPCANCHLSLPLLTKFIPVLCSEHMVCIKCLEAACKLPEPRCPCDCRLFTPYEIEQAKKYFVRQCELYCGNFFDCSEALDLPCGCHYCKECVRQDIIDGKRTESCFSCHKQFPQPFIEQWNKILREIESVDYAIRPVQPNAETQYQSPQCAICMDRIGLAQKFTLTCGHEFHKDCITEFGANFITTVVTTEMVCPIHTCKQPINNSDLQRAMVPKDFEKYCLKLLEAKHKLVQCPNCRHPHISEQVGPQEHVVCNKCNFQFCGTCLAQWIDPHDSKRCKFECVKTQIQMMEAALSPGEARQVGQCPECKTPSFSDDRCNSITCPVESCRTEWCFKCSCYRRPTISHHNMWHRPQCPHYYFVPNDDEKMKKDCPRCVKKGRLCNPPRNLKVPRRFDFDEYDIDE